ncbi:hypothetical protein [Rhodococcus sp. SJ]|uniref:hypothetical protein n=1 Tax=Rhodococcus sp. SJ TaxID=3434112 RepID=UPI000EBF3828|nr:MAG: hypothetical protein DCC47_16445 [Acidobacteriota bacterium]
MMRIPVSAPGARLESGSTPVRAAVLKVMFLPLDIGERPVPPPVPAVPYAEPFLPARIAGRTGYLERPAALLAFRHRTEPGTRLTFGAPTPAAHPRPYDGPAGACASLWEVPGAGPVLVCEILSADPPGAVLTWHSDPLFDGAETGFRRTLDTFLAPFGITADASLVDLFPRLDTRLPDTEVYRPLAQVAVRTAPPLTDEPSIEGLVVEVAGDAREAARRLVDGPPAGVLAEAAARSCGRLQAWHRPAATDVAVRKDGRALLLDLGGGYVGADSRETLYHLLGWTGLRAQLHADHRRLLTALRRHETLDPDEIRTALGDVARARVRLVELAVLSAEARPAHDDPKWARTLLVSSGAGEVTAVRAAVEELCAAAERVLWQRLHLRSTRRSWWADPKAMAAAATWVVFVVAVTAFAASTQVLAGAAIVAVAAGAAMGFVESLERRRAPKRRRRDRR